MENGRTRGREPWAEQTDTIINLDLDTSRFGIRFQDGVISYG